MPFGVLPNKLELTVARVTWNTNQRRGKEEEVRKIKVCS